MPGLISVALGKSVGRGEFLRLRSGNGLVERQLFTLLWVFDGPITVRGGRIISGVPPPPPDGHPPPLRWGGGGGKGCRKPLPTSQLFLSIRFRLFFRVF